MNVQRIMVRSLAAGITLSATPLWAGTAVAQHVDNAVSVSYAVVQQHEPRTSALDTRVSLDLHGVSVKQALQKIASQAGITVAFGEVVESASQKVSVSEKSIMARDAFDQVLQGTGIVYRVVGDNLVFERLLAFKVVSEGEVIGRVISSKTKQPVQGAVVQVAGTSHTATTGDDGRFRLTVPAGNQVLSVRGIGFVRHSHKMVVEEGKAVTVEIVLEPSASVLDEVIVTGTVVATERKAIPTPITVITAEDIEKRGVTRIEQLFRGEVPGVIALDAGSQIYQTDLGKIASSNVMVRGSADLANGSNPLKTFIDGVEIADAGYLGTIDPQSIERIEIITGPQAATIYGSGAMGGVMQIFTKKGNASGTMDITTSLRYGMMESSLSDGRTPLHNHMIGVTGGTGPDFSYSANVSYNYSGQWRPDLFSRRLGASLGASYTRGSLTARASYSRTSGRNGTSGSNSMFESPLFANLYGTVAGSYGAGAKRLVGTGFVSTQIVSNTSSQTASLNADYRQSSWLMHQLTVGSSRNDFDLEPVAPERSTPQDTLFRFQTSGTERLSWSYNATFQPQAFRGVSQTVLLGMSGSSRSSVRTNGYAASKSLSSLTDNDVTRSLPSRSLGGFLRWQAGLAEQVYFTLALRGETNNYYGSDYKIDWTPNYGVTYTFDYGDMTVKLLGSYGRATRPPSPEMREADGFFSASYDPPQFISQYANPHLTPEYSRGPQGGIEVYWGSLGSFTLTHYRQTVSDLIELLAVDSAAHRVISSGAIYWSTINQYLNSATIRQVGWEATATAALGPVSVKGTWSWADSRIASVDVRQRQYYEKYAGDQVGFSPTHTGNLTLSYARGGTSMTLVNSFIGTGRRYAREHWLFLIDGYKRLHTEMFRAGRFDEAIRSYAGYVKSDLAVTHRLAPWVSATVNVTNLGNSYGQDNGTLWPTLGRQTLIGLQIRTRR